MRYLSMRKINRHLKLFLKILVSVLILIFIFSKIDLGKFWQVLTKVNLTYFFGGLIFYLICFFLLTKRWQIITRYLKLDFTFLPLLKLNFLSSFYGTFLPGGHLTGEAIKCYKMVRQEKNWQERIIASIFLDRLLGFVALFILALLAVLLTPEKNFYLHPKIVITILLTTTVFLFLSIFLVNQKFFGLFSVTRKLINKIRLFNLSHYLNSAFEAVFSCCNSVRFFRDVIGLGIVVHIFNSLAIYFAALAVGIDVSVLTIVWVNALVTLFTAIPITITGLGVREGSFIALLALLGVATEKALVLSLLVLIIYIITALIGGLAEFYQVFLKNKF